ncbi:tautomerase family protein [Luteibacter sp. PPL201]|jgi:phenylpyruvate tautomerase PptA (4-oxalocrotonate tautomerase family)|uniref:Tautomerase family protein n=1 Tax=Luteibacter sahnii TaxID=3021977 RepID=A0ABT6BEZ0_9GAMM|nr:tautomerase family protein [Luteibacter sp. PPL193]MDY1549807.1 tautomerase family protein [Luteibacter sp. PPL193]
MPFTRISLHAGKSPDYHRAIADALDRALVEDFEVPETDRFTLFHPHPPGDLIFDRTYRGGPRSDDFVLFHVTTGRTRTAATKARFFKGLVDRLAVSPGIRPEDVMVVIANSALEDWSFASGVSEAQG